MPWNLALKHVDNTAYDLSELVRSTAGRDQSDNALALLEVSPDSQYAKAVLIEKDWERARPHIAEWEKGANNAPVLLAALIRRYSDQGQAEEARRALLRYIQFSPDQWAYELLAKYFKDAGDLERWQMTLDEFLTRSGDNWRSQNRVRVQIADYYMGLGQWDKAWPYAQAAAGTGVQWALLCGRAAPRGGRTGSRPSATRGRSPRTIRAAGGPRGISSASGPATATPRPPAALADRVLSSGEFGPVASPPQAIGYFYWLHGDPKKAVPYFRKAYDAAPSHVMCIPLILIADQLGDAASRDEWIQTLLTRHRNQAPNTARIFEILRKAGESDKLEAIDLQAIDKILGKINAAASRGNNEFFVGCYLEHHGKVEEARRHLETALRATAANRFMRAIAADHLQRLGVDIQAIGAGPDTVEREGNR